MKSLIASFCALALSVVLGWFGCSGSDNGMRAKPSSARDAGASDPFGSAGNSSAGSASVSPPSMPAMPAPMTDECAQQIADALDGQPDSLECTGLYSNFASKAIAKGVRPYAPASPLWSDGSEKERWVYLPAGKKIDTSDMAKWVFPEGTKLFKQFSVGGKRIETRIYEKREATGSWAHATYVWSSDGSSATRVTGGMSVTLSGNLGTFTGGKIYHVPAQRDCNECHDGQAEQVLGFEAVSLGLPGATGVTLKSLVDDKLLTTAPARSELMIGDDGTGAAAPALAWLHINCGMSCHNERSDATGQLTMMYLELDPAQLDGRSAKEFDAWKTTVGVAAKTQRWVGRKRIAPGNPAGSLLYTLITSRAGKNDQMPPLATTVVDTMHNAQVQTWISKLPR
jgi:hypothetical protein